MRHGGHNPPQYGHAFTDWWKRYGKTNLDYFAMNNGIRGPVGWNGKTDNVAAFQGNAGEAVALCVSNPAVVRQIIRNWNGKTEYVNICENDANDIHSCHCENCKALDALKPGESWVHNLADRYIHFANEVSKEALKNPQRRKSLPVCLQCLGAGAAPGKTDVQHRHRNCSDRFSHGQSEAICRRLEKKPA
jgi:hypothetical protein